MRRLASILSLFALALGIIAAPPLPARYPLLGNAPRPADSWTTVISSDNLLDPQWGGSATVINSNTVEFSVSGQTLLYSNDDYASVPGDVFRWEATCWVDSGTIDIYPRIARSGTNSYEQIVDGSYTVGTSPTNVIISGSFDLSHSGVRWDLYAQTSDHTGIVHVAEIRLLHKN